MVPYLIKKNIYIYKRIKRYNIKLRQEIGTTNYVNSQKLNGMDIQFEEKTSKDLRQQLTGTRT